MCCATFIAKYVLFIANLVFSLLGLATVGLGIALLIILRDFLEILPVEIIPISLIVLGSVVFFIGFLACCGAIKESRCMLICYSIVVGLLLIAFIYLTVVVLGSLDTLQEKVDGWIVSAFNNNDLRLVFHVLEASFRCCGTVGPASYLAINQPLPPSCCRVAEVPSTCAAQDAFRGCGDMVGSWMESFSGAIGAVLIVIIIIQTVALVFALFMTIAISNTKRRNEY